MADVKLRLRMSAEALAKALAGLSAPVVTVSAVAVADARCAALLEQGWPMGAVFAALRYASVTPASDVKAAVAACVDRELGTGTRGLMKLISGAGPRRAEVLVPACPALAAAGDRARLAHIARLSDTAVRGAAEAALRSMA